MATVTVASEVFKVLSFLVIEEEKKKKKRKAVRNEGGLNFAQSNSLCSPEDKLEMKYEYRTFRCESVQCVKTLAF